MSPCLITSLVVAVLCQATARQNDRSPAGDAVYRTFPGTTALSIASIVTREGEMPVMVPTAGDSVLGYAVVDNVKGKDRLITYIVVVDPGLKIQSVEILAYREPYGGEIRNESWRAQFLGKGPGDRLRFGREIRNITGATISVRAVTAGVKKVLQTLQSNWEILTDKSRRR